MLLGGHGQQGMFDGRGCGTGRRKKALEPPSSHISKCTLSYLRPLVPLEAVPDSQWDIPHAPWTAVVAEAVQHATAPIPFLAKKSEKGDFCFPSL